jgi:hypothetical protein
MKLIMNKLNIWGIDLVKDCIVIFSWTDLEIILKGLMIFTILNILNLLNID